MRLAAAFILAGLLDQTPVDNATLPGDFRALASCAYVALDRSEGTGIKKIDLPDQVHLALESGGVRYWQLIFTPAGRGQTHVEFSQVTTIFGTHGGKRIMPAVRECSGR